MKVSDMKGMFKKSTLKVLSVENPHGDYYELKLDSESKNWLPGEHVLLKIPNKKITGRKFRGFSVASTSEEGIMMFGTRTGKEISSFKKALIGLKAGDTVAINGPFGWFKLQPDKAPIVFVASGVGITPIRALLKEIESDHSRDVTLIYAAKDYYLYEEDLQTIVNNNEKIKMIKTQSRDETQTALKEVVNQYQGQAYYYLSGAVPVIKSLKKTIKENGVSGKRVINDPFFGY